MDSKIKKEQHNTTQQELMPNVRECRICLDSEAEGDKLIQPCLCSGSVSFVHEKCLKDWIIRSKDRNGEWVTCQLCKEKIYFEMTSENRCSNHSELSQKIDDNFLPFVFGVVLVILNLAFLIYLIVFMTQINFGTKLKDSEIFKLGIGISAFIVLFILFALVLHMLVKSYCVVQEETIERIKEKNKAPTPTVTNRAKAKSNTRIYPQSVMNGFD